MYRYDKQKPTTESVGWMFIAVVLVVILPYVLGLLVNIK
jgi:hypothetical protein